jgi:predicted membrane chloride channel (bestrophin family)
MILYDSRGLGFILRFEGSHFPRAALYACPSASLAVLFHFMIDEYQESFHFLVGFNPPFVWSAVSGVLAILLGLRISKAYDRYWEAITLMHQMRAEWFEAASNLFAFSMIAAKEDPGMLTKVREFQHVLVRLMSLMHGTALRQIGGDTEDFEVLDVQALDAQSLRYLAECEMVGTNRVETLLHWIQVLVTESIETGVIDVQAPIVTRAYQTLSRGMVNLHNARKISEVPFPFPLSQVIIALVLFQSLATPFLVASVVNQPVCAAIVTFLPMIGIWGVTFIAGVLEQPFGSDPNALPLSLLQHDFNMTLLMLSEDEAARAPRCSMKRRKSLRDLKHALIRGEKTATSMKRACAIALERSSTFHTIASGQTNKTSYTAGNLPTLGVSHQSILEGRRKHILNLGIQSEPSIASTPTFDVEEHFLESGFLLKRCRTTGDHRQSQYRNSGIFQEPAKLRKLSSRSDSEISYRNELVNISTECKDRSAEDHLNALINSSQQTSEAVKLLLQVQAHNLQPNLSLLATPSQATTPVSITPVHSPRDSDHEASNDIQLRMDDVASEDVAYRKSPAVIVL